MASFYEEYAQWMKKGGAATQSPIVKDLKAGKTWAAGNGSSSGGSSSGGGTTQPKESQSLLSTAMDWITRPMQGVQGVALGALKSAKEGSSAGEAISNALGTGFRAAVIPGDENRVQGIDVYDAVGELVDKNYKPSTFDDVSSADDWSTFGAAVGRGAGGFGLDVALDPFSYGTLGMAPLAKAGVRAATKALSPATGVRAVTGGGIVDDLIPASAASVEKQLAGTAAHVADSATPAAAEKAAKQAPEAASVDVGSLGALNVSRPLDLSRKAIDSTATPNKITAPKSPVTTTTLRDRISVTSPKVVETFDKVARAVEKVKSTKADELLDDAPAATSAAVKKGDIAGFARAYFGNSDESIAKINNGGVVSEVFPQTVVNNLSRPGAMGYMNKLVGAAQAARARNAPLPQLEAFITNAQRFMQDGTVPGTPAHVAPPAAAGEAAELTTADLLREALKKKDKAGKYTTYNDLGREAQKAFGNTITRQLVSQQTKSSMTDDVFESLRAMLNDTAPVTPDMLEDMPKAVKDFVANDLKLTAADFEMTTAAKLRSFDELIAMPRASNKETIDQMSRTELRTLAAMNHTSVGALANDAEAVARKLSGDAFDPSKVKKEGGISRFQGENGKMYGVRDGDVAVHAITEAVESARKGIYAKYAEDAGIHPTAIPARKKSDLAWDAMPGVLRTIESASFNSGSLPGVRLGDTKVPLLPSQVYDAVNELAAEGFGDSIVKLGKQVLTNPGTSAPTTMFHEALATFMRSGDVNATMTALTRSKSPYTGVELKNNKMANGGRGTRKEAYTGAELADAAMRLIKTIAPKMNEKSAALAAQYASKTLSDASVITTKVMEPFNEALAQSTGHGINYLAGIPERIAELSAKLGASPYATAAAADSVSAQLPVWAVKRAKSIEQTQTAFRNAAAMGRSADEIKAMGAAQDAKHVPVSLKAADDMTEEIVEAAALGAKPGDDLYPLGTGQESALKEEVASRSAYGQFVNFFQTRFDGKHGGVVGGIDFTAFTRSAMASPARDITNRYRDIMAWSKRHNTIRVGDSTETHGSAAFHLLQQGLDEVPDALRATPDGEAIAAALEDLKPVMEYFFDIKGAGISGDMYWRSNTGNARYLERSMQTAHFSRTYGDVFTDMIGKGEPQDFWKHVKVDNPAEFLIKYNVAVHHALGEFGSVNRMIDKLKTTGLVSSKPMEGFAKPALDGNSFFFAGLEDSGLYVDKAILDAMSEVDIKLYALRSFPADNPITTIFDPAMSAWKTGMTIFRPGHHVRNVMSNGALSYIDQGAKNLGTSGYVAARLLHKRTGDTGLAGISEVERLIHGDISGLKSGADEVISTVKTKNGKPFDITYEGLNDAFSARGGYRDFTHSEDILQGSGRIQKAADLATFKGTKLGDTVATVSEVTDHHGYLQHFTQIVMNEAKHIGGKFKSPGELYDYAIERAYKFHPDASVLAPFEAKIMRRLAPFYTWFRGTLPAVVESAVMHPGRVMVAPKASFNIAQMMGIDAESYSDPWPEDADVPEYMRESAFGPNLMIGDQAFAMNPGFAHQDLASTFFGKGIPLNEDGSYDVSSFVPGVLDGVGKGILSFLGPGIKLPLELMSGVEFDTGNTIRDRADHIDKSIPFVNYLTSTSGIQFTGNILGAPTALAEGRLHENSSVDRGYRPSIFEEGLSGDGGDEASRKVMNWIFGQGAQKVNSSAQAAEDTAQRNARLDARESGGDVRAAVAAAATPGGAAGLQRNAPAAEQPVGIEGFLKALSDWQSGTKSEGTENTPKPSTGSSGGSSKKPAGELSIPRFDAPEMPAELNYEDGAILNELAEQYGLKAPTVSQMGSAAKDIQRDKLRQQSARNWTGYATTNLEQLAAANPDLSLSELLMLLRTLTPNEYR